MTECGAILTPAEQEELMVESMIEAIENKIAADGVPDILVFCDYPTAKVWHRFNPPEASYGAWLAAKTRIDGYCAVRGIGVHRERVDFDWPDDMQERVDRALHQSGLTPRVAVVIPHEDGGATIYAAKHD